MVIYSESASCIGGSTREVIWVQFNGLMVMFSIHSDAFIRQQFSSVAILKCVHFTLRQRRW